MVKLAAVLAGLVLAASGLTASEVQTTLVRAYHKNERSRTLLFKNGMVLAGRTGLRSEGGHFVEWFNPESLELEHEVKVKHSIRGLKDAGDCQVLAYGTVAYSFIDVCAADGPTAVTHSFPANYIPHAGTPDGQGRFLFSEPNAGIYRFSAGRRGAHLGEHISFTRAMDAWYDRVWISAYSNLWVLDPRSGEREPVFKEENEIYGLKYTQAITSRAGRERLVATARDDQKLVVVDPQTLELVSALDLKGEPEGVVPYGNCAVVTLSSDKRVLFVELASDETQVVDVWNASKAGDRLKYPSEVAVDPETKTVFLRSTYPCPTCSVTQSSLFAVNATDTEEISRCLGGSLR